MIIVLLGPPGVGKGTQAKIIVERHGVAHLSTGDMLREEKASGSALGKKVQAIMDRGDLVSDAVIEELITARIGLPDCKPGFILDGAVRTVPQAEMVDRVLKARGRAVDVAILMEVDEDELVNRLKRRIRDAKDRGLPVRADDNEETFRKRQKVFRDQTAPLIPYYQAQGKLRTIDGMGAIEEVAAAIAGVLKEIRN